VRELKAHNFRAHAITAFRRHCVRFFLCGVSSPLMRLTAPSTIIRKQAGKASKRLHSDTCRLKSVNCRDRATQCRNLQHLLLLAAKRNTFPPFCLRNPAATALPCRHNGLAIPPHPICNPTTTTLQFRHNHLAIPPQRPCNSATTALQSRRNGLAIPPHPHCTPSRSSGCFHPDANAVFPPL